MSETVADVESPVVPKPAPAPWAFDGGVGIYSLPRDGVHAFVDADGVQQSIREGLVALVYGRQLGELEVNARLIAAAPDLLAALKGMLSGEWLDNAKAAEEAIAKAEGVDHV